MKIKRLFLLSILFTKSFLLTGCFLYKETRSQSIYRNSKSKRNYLTVNTFTHSHCGCTDIYAKKFENGNLTYAFYYGCTPFYQAQKIIYIYDNNNKLTESKKYSLVDTAYYDTNFDSLDLFVIKIIDSFRLKQNPVLPEYKLCQKSYKGLALTQ